MNVLYITPWYPNRRDALDGLFVRKHAQAVARHAAVSVVCVKTDAEASAFDVAVEEVEGVLEVVVSFPFVHVPGLSLLSKTVNLFRAFARGYSVVRERRGEPDVCQANVLTRCGVLALLLKLWRGTPYVVVEHWTRYLPSDFHYTGFVRRRLTEAVVRHAEMLLPVSRQLGQAMKECGLACRRVSVIDNVVDDFFYGACTEPSPRKDGRQRLLHVSSLADDQKNVSGLLRAVGRLKELRQDFELVVVGQGGDYARLRSLSESLGLGDVVSFVGGQTPREVFRWLSSSDLFVLFSRYENAPVVISESLAVGVPVVSSRVGGIADMVDEESGALVEPEDEEGLAEAISAVLDGRLSFDTGAIRQCGLRYSFDDVGARLMEVYAEAMRGRKRKDKGGEA